MPTVDNLTRHRSELHVSVAAQLCATAHVLRPGSCPGICVDRHFDPLTLVWAFRASGAPRGELHDVLLFLKVGFAPVWPRILPRVLPRILERMCALLVLHSSLVSAFAFAAFVAIVVFAADACIAALLWMPTVPTRL